VLYPSVDAQDSTDRIVVESAEVMRPCYELGMKVLEEEMAVRDFLKSRLP